MNSDFDYACRVMTDQIWRYINNKHIAIHPDTIDVIYNAIRDHTAYLEVLEALQETQHALSGDKWQRVDNALVKAGVKP